MYHYLSFALQKSLDCTASSGCPFRDAERALFFLQTDTTIPSTFKGRRGSPLCLAILAIHLPTLLSPGS